MENKLIAKNGIPVYSYTNPSQHSFFISLFLRAGSMYESAAESGITHFLEHASIRNINFIMGGELYSVLDRYGLEFNASTYSEMVQFYITGASHNFRIAADIISKLFLPVSLPKSEIDAERDRIRAEIREVDDKSSLATFASSVVWEDTSLSRSITGTAGSVRKIGGKALESYRQRTFTADNVFLYVTGNVAESDVSYLCDLIGAHTLAVGEAHKNVAPVPAAFLKRSPEVHVKCATFTKVRFTFDIDMSRVTLAEMDLLYDQLLGGYNSDFFIELSERRGLFYDLGGSLERYLNVGTFSFAYELKEAKLYEALSMTVDILRRMKSEAIPRDKFMRASYVDNAMMLYDDARELNFTFAYDNHIMGIGYTDLADRRDAYSKITEERIREIAAEIFTPGGLTLSLKGNKKRLDIEKIKSIISEL